MKLILKPVGAGIKKRLEQVLKLLELALKTIDESRENVPHIYIGLHFRLILYGPS